MTIDALNALAEAAQAALDEAAATRATAKTATSNAKQAVAALSSAGADVIAAIKAKVAVTGPSVWALADLPEPSTPSPVGTPGTPVNFRAELVQDGGLKLTWKYVNPPNAIGTVYQIARQVGAGGTMTILGATGKKSFVDETLPSGVAQVTYKITAIRSTKQGSPAEFTVKLGTGGAGEMTAMVVQGGQGPNAPKLAA